MTEGYALRYVEENMSVVIILYTSIELFILPRCAYATSVNYLSHRSSFLPLLVEGFLTFIDTLRRHLPLLHCPSSSAYSPERRQRA